MAPAAIAGADIRKAYGDLVAPDTLTEWIASPASAPGRQVSSPWPERIEIASSNASEDRASIRGNIVEMTSSGEAGRTAFEATLTRSSGEWRIRTFEMASGGNAQSPSAAKDEQPPPAGGDDTRAAVAVIDDYYAAIADHDYGRAYRHWGTNGPPGQSEAEFAAGFAQTTVVHVTPGTLSRIEGAAGSRYIDIPVSVVATLKNGATQRFEGTYTLRRSVVDGATEADRRWHIDRASLRRSK